MWYANKITSDNLLQMHTPPIVTGLRGIYLYFRCVMIPSAEVCVGRGEKSNARKCFGDLTAIYCEGV